MDCYYYYFVYDHYLKESLTQLSLHKLWQGEKLNIGLRRQVLIRNTLLTNNCLWIRQDNDNNNNNNNEDERMQEETWLDACINDLEKDEEEREQEKEQNIKNDSFYINSHKKEQESMIPITLEHQRRYHETIKIDNTYWRWQL